MVAPHAQRPVKPDIIFGTARQAQEASKTLGFEAVIDSTLGALTDDYGKLTFIETVMDHIRKVSNEDIGAYAPIAGLPDFLEAVKYATFYDNPPKAFIKAIATPGGTGALKHAVGIYSNPGESVLTSDWYWGPYHTIADEHGRKLETYSLFNEKGGFNLESFKAKVDDLMTRQDRLLILLNSPAHNPTGYSLTMEEWEQVVSHLKDHSNNETKKIVLFVDIAYIDFSGPLQESRAFFSHFNNLPDNFLVLVGYSMSKGYTLYGMRSGAILCVTQNEAIAEEFFHACSYSNRGAWSNGTRAAQRTLVDVVNSPELLSKVNAERDVYRQMLAARCKAFTEEAARVGLVTAPFHSGFFISIPCKKTFEVYEELKKRNLFLIPLAAGLRFATCAVSESKCRKAPSIIKEVLEMIEG
jgi:aromatic-amino-acid transaminase